MNRRVVSFLRTVPMIIVMATIFVLSAQPGDRLSLSLFPGVDKLAHFAVYGLLALSALFAFSEDRKRNSLKMVILLTVLLCVAYGVSDEFHQAFVPGRTPSFFDIAADGAGAAIASLLYVIYRQRRGTFLPQ